MTLWTARLPGQHVLDALERLSQPSVPQPLPNSQSIGPSTYFVPLSAEQVKTAYKASDAPIPQGATLQEEEMLLVVEAPFSTCGIFLEEMYGGCKYMMTRGPTLIIHGNSQVPSAHAFVHVGSLQLTSDTLTSNGFVAEVSISGQPWSILTAFSTNENSGASPPSSSASSAAPAETTSSNTVLDGTTSSPSQDTLQCVIAQISLSDVLGGKTPTTLFSGSVTITQQDQKLVATAQIGAEPIVIEAMCTRSGFALMSEKAPQATDTTTSDPSQDTFGTSNSSDTQSDAGVDEQTHPRSGTITGHIVDRQGNPVQQAQILVRVGSSHDGKVVVQTQVGPDGHYTLHVPDGSYRIEALVETTFQGVSWHLPLHPDDDIDDAQGVATGLVKDFTWQLKGLRPGGNAANHADYYGGQVFLSFPSTRVPGTAYTIALMPQGLLVDGSTGEVMSCTLMQGQSTDGADNPFFDIPLGVYTVTGTAFADGTSLPFPLSTRSSELSTTLTFSPNTVGIQPATLFLVSGSAPASFSS